MANIEKIRDLLGSGCSNEIVANATGVSPSYISQLMAEDSFRDSVVELRSKALTANTDRDREIDTIEDTLISSLKEQVTYGLFTKPRDLLAAFSVINKAARRGVSSSANTLINQQVVVLNMPTTILKSFTLNSQSEVVSVGDQSMVTMSSKQLINNLAAGENGDKYKEMTKFMGGNAENSLLNNGEKGYGNSLSSAGLLAIAEQHRLREQNSAISTDYQEVTVESGREKI